MLVGRWILCVDKGSKETGQNEFVRIVAELERVGSGAGGPWTGSGSAANSGGCVGVPSGRAPSNQYIGASWMEHRWCIATIQAGSCPPPPQGRQVRKFSIPPPPPWGRGGRGEENGQANSWIPQILWGIWGQWGGANHGGSTAWGRPAAQLSRSRFQGPSYTHRGTGLPREVNGFPPLID